MLVFPKFVLFYSIIRDACQILEKNSAFLALLWMDEILAVSFYPMQISKFIYMPTSRSGRTVVYLMENEIPYPLAIKWIALVR